jgi:multidrug efflux pump subunit AcrA (membrane-fusion protein)
VRYDVEKRGGATQGEWRSRFQKVRTELASERSALERAQLELEKVAGSSDSWKLAPPGVSASNSEAPLDYRLRNEIRQHRAEVDRLEKQLRDLEVEANLAGVPQEWRQ